MSTWTSADLPSFAGRTVILFTHGSAGLADVDEIIELADGRVLDRRLPDRQTSS